jgi:dCMP deaminase
MKVLIVYIPVLHQGYIDLIKRQKPDTIYLVSADGIKSLDPIISGQLSRDIRARPLKKVTAEIQKEFPECGVKRFTGDTFLYIEKYSTVVMPNEDISYVIQKQLKKETKIVFDDAFLRWDWVNTNTPKSVNNGQFPVTTEEKDHLFMAHALLQASGSSDVWRQVGALIPYGDNKSLTGFNMHMPTNNTHYVLGDPRLNMKPGESPEICSAIHAEALVISTAAREGIALEGKSIYTTTFPCPVCARLIAKSGIKKVFFKEGYSVLDAADILVYEGVEIFQVK